MNLKYWQDLQKTSRWVAREVLELSEYDIEIHHIKGTSNGHADALSRRPNYYQGEHNNQNVVVPPDKLFVRATHMEWIEAEEPPWLIQIKEMEKEHPVYDQEEFILWPWVDPHNLKKVDNMWYKDGRRVVTNDLTYWRELIKTHHDPPVYGHPGINQTIWLLERYYWWPQLQKEVADYSGLKNCCNVWGFGLSAMQRLI